MTDPGLSEATPSLPSLSGRVLDGRYRMDSLVGAGGMGVVYAGWHIKLEKRVAIKLLDPRFADRPDAVKRFLREARSASKISHRNVVEVMDFGQDEDLVYFVMEFLEGADLSAVIRRSAPLPWPRAKRILVQIVRALKAAHTQGIVHRDIKPANCFVVKTPDDEPDVVKVLDFGIAKVVDPGTHTDGLTSTSQVIGTALYMAPEQAMGKPIDARTDVYALGTMAFEMVSGRKPFVGATGFEVLMKRVNEPPPSVREYVPTLELGVDAMIRCAMARDPDHRYQSMRAFEEALVELGGDATSRDDLRVPLLTRADLEAAAEVSPAHSEATADRTPRVAEADSSTLTSHRDADATPGGSGTPLWGPVGATEVGPPLRADVPSLEPSQVETASVSAPVQSDAAAVRASDAAAVELASSVSAPHPRRARWWPVAALAVLALGGGAIWLARQPGESAAVAAADDRQPPSPMTPAASQAKAPEEPKPAAGAADGSAGEAEHPPESAEGDPDDLQVAPPNVGAKDEPTAGEPSADEPTSAKPPVDATRDTSAARKTQKKKGGRKPRPAATREAALSALSRKAKKRCTAAAGTKVALNVFVSAAGTFSTPRDGGSTAGQDAVSCVIGVVKGSTIPSGASELRHVNVSF